MQAEHAEPAEKPRDLTDMSLEDLLNEDIVPINVLASHTHLKNEFMVGYRYMFMEMGHNQEGTRDVSVQEVLQTYPVAHSRMESQMHMVDLMYAPSDWVTVMTMVPYKMNYMHHVLRTGPGPSDYTSGIGDVTFMSSFNVVGDPHGHGQRLVINAGFTAPTGSIDEAEGGRRFEYPMQLGSGTWDLLPGLTYLGHSAAWAWGAQALFTVRLGENENHYRLGHVYRLSAWTQFEVLDWFGPSARLDWHGWGNIQGADPELDPNRNPAFDPNKQAGERLDFLMGLNFYVPGGPLKGTRFSLEGGVPLYQNILGPNLAVDWMITAGLSYSFR
ncbi:MAG TPA: hypothetical protein VL361_25280 [Candidatus Limnocylindrales bacterium]|nr:hypothetical protein [Candidatus Limnocylindrales bacterium]